MAENDEVSPPAPAFRLRWDVYLSFRGEDTRHGFTDRLYEALLVEGVRAFRDNEGTSEGDEARIDAIHDSAAAIAVVSPSYASSQWCLEELATICECRRLLIPVFFNVDPSHVRRQKGPFEEDFRSLERKFGVENVVRWRNAMGKAGGISGWVYENSKELELIQLLVSRILAELSNTPMGVASYAVGLNYRVEELLRLLDVKSNGIRVLGLHGIGGVGKTTLAKAVYNKLISHFEHRSFISNVREMSMQQNGLVSLQNKLLHDLSGTASQVDDANAAKISIEKMLHEKRVLIVLDDVDNGSNLVAKREWLYEGSRIIITTRDRDVLIAHHVSEMYEVRALGSSDSLDLFRYHALRTKKASETFLSLSKQIVSLTGGLPLALEVFGSFLFDKRRVEEWEDALQKLRQIRPCHLQDVLRISFDGLDEEEKCIFLDIACLFVNLEMGRDEVIDVVKGCGFRALTVNVLVARSLVKFQEKSVWMHDQIRDMGRQIVHHESLADPGMRSRLWDHSEILTVMKDRMGTRCNQGIILDFEKNHKEVIPNSLSLDTFQMTPNITSVITYLMGLWREYSYSGAKKEGEVVLQTEPFQKMVRLRLLQLSNVRLEGNFKCIPPELKWLQWRKCPLKNLPSDFCPQQLAVLDLSDSSKIENVWGLRRWSWCKNKVAESLMVMNLHGCCKLTAVPDLSSHRALEKLILERCTSLTAIHKSLGDATTLRHLNLRGCSNLVDFPHDVSGLKHLETLILSGCSKLKELPQNMDCLSFLRKLLIDNTAIERLPESLFRLSNLEVLSLDECQSLKWLPPCIGKLDSLRDLSLNGLALEELPDSIGCLVNLETLSLMRCKSLTVIPGSVGNLRMLARFWLNGRSVMELPASIGSLSYLKYFSVGNCSSLTKLPVSIGQLASLVELHLDGISIIDLPDEVDGLKSLERLEMRNCKSLRSLPDSIGHLVTLTRLIISNASIVELPESIGMLKNLTMLTLDNCSKLCRLPSSIGYLNFLHHLYMKGTSVTELPESFGMLSRLMILKLGKKPYREVSEDPETTEIATKPIVLPSSFSNLSVLEEFDAHAWKISGKIPDDFEKLSCLETLKLGHNDFHSLPCSLRGLSILKKLFLPHCENLLVLPPLPSSLLELNAESCTALETLSNLSNLENLHDLNLANCVKLKGIPGLECLKSLRRLYMGGCSSCSSVVKGKLDKLALKYMFNLSVPGSEIPDWFTPDVICYLKPKNRVIKAVIVCAVVSINHQIPDDLRDQLPFVAGIEIRILRENDLKPIYTTVPRLLGVPKNDEDHFYLCRYPDFRPLVLCLQEGDKIQVARRNPPVVKGVQLKKCGIHLVFEHDDDYDGDENWLHESQQSVSQKLATFVGSEEDTRIRDNISENDGETEGRKQSKRLLSSNHRNYFVLLFIALPSAFLLLGWLVFMLFT
ncbi:disease resistance protein RPV1-like isoform X1 [Rhododendron vialii]|uniref:disease resistance protein RPV1-like isoform X1 n=1 Tax=Rhododendron vialii TaxID=182163 RepID=UPI00265FB1F0|nr:disease resistance protein RPV1-like isoform X1 [Rhododendron vialii]